MDSIPNFTTSDFKSHFFTPNSDTDSLYGQDPENFLIAPFSAFKDLMNLPIPLYRRSVTQLYVITRGNMIKTCNSNSVSITNNQAHFWLQDQITGLEYFSEDVDGYYCHFTTEFLVQSKFTTMVMNDFIPLNSHMEQQAVTLPNATVSLLINNLTRMHEIYLQNYDPKLLRTYLLSVLYEIKNALPEFSPLHSNDNRQAKLVNDFKQLLADNITREQHIQYYADRLNVSPNHLNKTVKQLTGKSTKTWVNETLILGAKILLKQSDLSIQEIGYTLGFTDPSYFTRFFRKHTGLAPSNFLKTLEND